MQSAPPEHPDTSPTAPNTQRDRDEAKYTERDHDNMKPQDRFSYVDAERRGHIMAGWISAGWVSQSASSATSGGVRAKRAKQNGLMENGFIAFLEGFGVQTKSYLTMMSR
jgi:hypothetical protein